MLAWSDVDADVRELAFMISDKLRDEGIWLSSLFAPNDPAEIVFAIHFYFTSRWETVEYAVELVGRGIGAEMTLQSWKSLHLMTHAEAVTEIFRCRREHGDGLSVAL